MGQRVGDRFQGCGAIGFICARLLLAGAIVLGSVTGAEAHIERARQTFTYGAVIHDFDLDGQSNGVINIGDFDGFAQCFNGPDVAPGAGCPVLGEGLQRNRTLPPSGTFTLHGRPIDILPDGKVLMDFRTRIYDPQHGRWLQRDAVAYADGPNLYESFGGNAASFTDPMGLWLADRVGEIVSAKGRLSLGDIVELGKELNSSARNQISPLTENELALLRVIGGAQHGTPWTAETLSPALREQAQKDFPGLTITYQYRAEATLATRRRILRILTIQNPHFSQYVTELYRVSRDFNPVHFAAERGWQVGSGEESITGVKVSRAQAAAEFVVYLALLKGAQTAPKAITEAAGGEVPGTALTVAPGRQTTLDRTDIRFSQRTAGGSGRAEPLRASLSERGFTDPIDVVEVSPGRYVAIDNTRLALAGELGIERIPVRVFRPTDPLPPEMIASGRFGEAARTWGDATLYRTATQRPPLPTEGTTEAPRLPSKTP